MFIRPVKPSDVEPLMDMLLDRDQFDQDGLHHVQKTLTHHFRSTVGNPCQSQVFCTKP